MPISELHKKKRKKNLIVFALILLFIALVWMITMVRMANAGTLSPECKNPFTQSQIDHQKKISQVAQDWETEWNDVHGPARQDVVNRMNQDNIAHQAKIAQTSQKWIAEWNSIYAPERVKVEQRMNQDNIAHQAKIAAQPEKWWDDYRKRCYVNE